MEEFLKSYIGSRAKFGTARWGDVVVEVASFTPATDGDLVVYFGDVEKSLRPLVRVHSECVFSQVLGSELCDCSAQLEMALDALSKAQGGILFYLRFDGRGTGLAAKLKATDLEVRGVDTYDSRIQIGVPPENRDFRAIGGYLKERGILRIRLLSNSPKKLEDIRSAGVDVDMCPLFVKNPNPEVKKLYETKRTKFGHILPRQEREHEGGGEVKTQKFTDEEKRLFSRMIDYYIREEEREIKQLSLPSGNRDFIPRCRERLSAFKSIRSKVSTLLF